jgi:uracil phosphoribosyltransferase
MMRTIQIQSGELTVRPRFIHPGYDLDSLTSFATRRNPKRAFLFTSKLTGKHIPTRPTTLLTAYADLARAAELRNTDMYVIGMAETAIGLAHGVFEALLKAGHRGGFLHSTRYHLQASKLFGFEEEHCHASEHLLFAPTDLTALKAAKSLVIVDDEISTGSTLVNVLKEYVGKYAGVDEIVLASLTSFISDARKQEIVRMFPSTEIRFASLFEGDFDFTPKPDWVSEAMPVLKGNGDVKDALFATNFGRTGVTALLEVRPAFELPTAGRVLVLGTGEFLYPALLLAAQVEAAGAECLFQSTTRSPVSVGDSINHAFAFKDNYGDEIENFVYNVGSESYDRIFVCYETADCAAHELPFAHTKVYFNSDQAILA